VHLCKPGAMTMNTTAKRIRTCLLAAALQIFAVAGERGVAAQPTTKQGAGDGIVPTVEVLQRVRAARQKDPGKFGSDAKVPSLLAQVSDYPTVTITVDPADPNDFVVAINETRYRAGARAFRVVPGPASVIVTRRGKEPCKATLEVTVDGPNVIACRL
jgi:hypothetical protein